MKLIIDIPEKSLDLLNNGGVDWLGAEHILDAVSKGTPYEERPTGKWVGISEYLNHLEKKFGEKYSVSSLYDNLIFCNQCWQMIDIKKNFCPDCGADMRGGRE